MNNADATLVRLRAQLDPAGPGAVARPGRRNTTLDYAALHERVARAAGALRRRAWAGDLSPWRWSAFWSN